MENFRFSPGFDTEYLEALYSDDLAYAEDVFGQFLQTLPDSLRELEQAFQSRLVPEFRSKAHRIKPSFSYIGLPALTARMELLEKSSGQAAAVDEVSDLYRSVLQEIAAAVPLVEDECRRIREYNQQHA